jgi:hypothetical protein
VRLLITLPTVTAWNCLTALPKVHEKELMIQKGYILISSMFSISLTNKKAVFLKN